MTQWSILAINTGHNGSAALLIDGELKYYCEEERLSRMKYDGNPFRAMLEAMSMVPNIDELIIGGTSADLSKLPWTMEDSYTALVRKFNPNVKVTNLGHQHHLGHAAGAFYNSGFETACAVVIDGAGSRHNVVSNNNEIISTGYETESIYLCEYPHGFKPIYKRYSDNKTNFYIDEIQEYDESVTITKAYEAVTHYLGFGFIEAGKTMGLAPYGKRDPNIPPIFVQGKGNNNLLKPLYPAGAIIDENRFEYLRKTKDPQVWHRDFSQITEIEKNLAWHVQTETQKIVGDLIEFAVLKTNQKNIVIAGGYGLNCVANYYFKKRFPNLNIYIDPISHDGGTAIGLAKLAWHVNSQSSEIKPLTSLYLGKFPDYQKIDLLANLNSLSIERTSSIKIAELLSDQEIVAIFCGRSEGGPRALGNRSILFDPRDPNGKDKVNQVKGREWFRPFAGSVLEEKSQNYFDLRGMESSPFMMYAVDVKTKEIPSITHVDDTCRIQTVNREQNSYFYDLINEFYQITGLPILFNTSFNLAGEPLVESLEDAFSTLKRSELKYLYLPELELLIKK